MKVLVVGKGGREHALAWKLAQSPRVERIFAAPGNPGIAGVAQCVEIRADLDPSTGDQLQAEIRRLRDFALEQQIDLTVVGPESSLSGGLVDVFTAAGLKAFGPTAAAARLECDKAFSKELMASIGVPTALHQTFTDSAAAIAYVEEQGAPIVIKASGLAAGKGAVVCQTLEEARSAIGEIMDERIFGSAGDSVVVEEFMTGEEASFFAITDGTDFVTLVTAQDHKAAYDHDKGPNTGGMGAYAPAPVMTPELIQSAQDRVVVPVLREMRARGCPFQGVLYCGLMIDASGPRVVEFNCRFGDPEAQVILPLLETDLADVLEAACDGRLGDLEISNSPGAAVCVVMASGGYPGKYSSGKAIGGIDTVDHRSGVVVFHAGTDMANGELVTSGGRVLGVTAAAHDIAAAVNQAYGAVGSISFDKAQFRRDIGHRALARLG
jgi:phosphoribosylamine---glycine ligase